MDIEDICTPDNDISDGSFDFDFIESNRIAQDFENAIDLFGDLNSFNDSPIDPLTFQPDILPEFNALRECIVAQVRTYPDNIRIAFIKKYLEEISKFFNFHHLKEIKAIIDQMLSEKPKNKDD